MNKRVLFFGGTFDPPHREHVNMLAAAVEEFAPYKTIVEPTFIPPHKETFCCASPRDRFEMCRIAFSGIKNAEVDDYEITREGKSYSYLTVREMKNRFPDCEILFLMGTDMLSGFATWKNPRDILECATPLLCVRDGENQTSEETVNGFYEKFGVTPYVLKYEGENMSSTDCKIRIMLSLPTDALSDEIRDYIEERGLYRSDEKFEFVKNNLKPERIEHTANVISYALKKCSALGIEKGKALTAALLHDCAKYLKVDQYDGFRMPQGVPSPVVHQYLGAFVAEKILGVTDSDVLDAIRYHTSGRENMSRLEKLIFTADMLEKGRSFDGVDELRKFADEDFENGFRRALQRSYEFVKNSGKPLYSLTEKAVNRYKI